MPGAAERSSGTLVPIDGRDKSSFGGRSEETVVAPRLLKPETPARWENTPNPALGNRLGQDIGGGSFGVAQGPNYFEDFAAGGKHSSASVLVGIHRSHEFDFVAAVVPFASGGIDLTPSVRVSPFSRSPFFRHRYVHLSSITTRFTASNHRTTFHLDFHILSNVFDVHRMILRGFGDNANKVERG